MIANLLVVRLIGSSVDLGTDDGADLDADVVETEGSSERGRGDDQRTISGRTRR